MFPNRFSIYMHDTPSRLFFRDERTFSHGCIGYRILDFAHVLLTGQMEDPISGFVNFLEKQRGPNQLISACLYTI